MRPSFELYARGCFDSFDYFSSDDATWLSDQGDNRQCSQERAEMLIQVSPEVKSVKRMTCREK